MKPRLTTPAHTHGHGRLRSTSIGLPTARSWNTSARKTISGCKDCRNRPSRKLGTNTISPFSDPLPKKLSVQNFVRKYSIEATILQAKRIERFADVVAFGTRIYIPHTRRTDFQDTVALSLRLRKEGMEPVPHVVARRIESFSILDAY